ncbi:hypothetical protein [Coralliovum pocilloporae]|uniref:hypothetical protein n=1 Tax=Coralliovum pocilloporae TaxID=3066369 RepID=UPI003306B16A
MTSTFKKTATALVAAVMLSTSMASTMTTTAEAGYRSHHRHHGHSNAGRAAAIGLAAGIGIAILGSALAAKKARPKYGTSEYACMRARQWKELVDSARDILKRDIRLQRRYGGNEASVRFSRQELKRRQKEHRRWVRKCRARLY